MTSITTLVDGFDGSSLDATLWSSFASAAGTFTESGSQLALVNTSHGGVFSNVGISSAQSYVLDDGDSCYMDLASVGATHLCFRLVSGTVGSSGLWAGFSLTTTLKNESSVAAGATQDSGSNVAGNAGAFSTADDRTVYRFLQLRRSAGNMLFETSADAASWTQQDSVALSWLTGSPAITAVIRDVSGPVTFIGSVLNGINTSGSAATGLPGFPAFQFTNAFVMDMARRR